MNTANLTQYRLKVGSELWHKFRTIGLNEEDSKSVGCKPYPGGIGSSEMGTVLGLSKNYRPCTQEYYHYKVGTEIPTQKANRAMLRGKILQPVVSVIWMLYNGEDDSWVPAFEDYQNGDRAMRDMLAVRKARKVNAYFVNNDYPWLFSSLDFFAEKGTIGLLPGPGGFPEKHSEGFPVEIKTVNQNYAKLWEAGIPQSAIVQLNQEMICTNSNYGEIAVLFPDDFSFKIFPFYRDGELCERIIHWGKVFWDKVIKSREAKELRDRYYQEGKTNEGEHMQSIIDSNEPEPDEGEAYNEYIKERYTQVINSVPGNVGLFDRCLEDETCRIYTNMINEKRTGIQNDLLKLLESSGAEVIDFESLGKITYLANKNGVRSLRFDLKMKPPKSRAEEEFKKLNFKLI